MDHVPKNCVSVQVFEKEKRDVLIRRQMDISVKLARKSSKGILKQFQFREDIANTIV
jgi:hypothetical protein